MQWHPTLNPNTKTKLQGQSIYISIIGYTSIYLDETSGERSEFPSGAMTSINGQKRNVMKRGTEGMQ